MTVRTVSLEVTYDGEVLTNVLGARGQVVADSGWPTCSVFVTSKPGEAAWGQDNDISVIAGAGNNVTRFVGKVRRYRPSAFPKAVEMVCMGTLAYANEWAPNEDIDFNEQFPGGATDQQIVTWALDHVPGVVYSGSNIGGTGIVLGTVGEAPNLSGAPEAFDWQAGTKAWVYIQNIDRATMYRTFQAQDGTIHRVRMVGHPNATPDFTLTDADILDGATASRDTERTRNYVTVIGHTYPNVAPIAATVTAEAWGSNGFQGPGDDPATRHAEDFSSDLIESSGIEDGVWDGRPGLRASDIAEQVLLDVNKQFVEATVPSWRDDTHGPGMTCLLSMLDRLLVEEPMWVQSYDWEVNEDGWTATYGMTGGGLPVDAPRAIV